MVRNPAPGPVVDPHLLWRPSRGPLSVRRKPAPPEVVRRRVREEDEHVRRYMAAMDVRFSIPGRVFGEMTEAMIL